MNGSSKPNDHSADAVATPMSLAQPPVTSPPSENAAPLDSSIPDAATPARGGFLRKLASRGALAMVDQAIVSLGNFVSVFLLGNYLPKAQFGAFGTLLEVWLFLNGLQQAVVIYPLLVRGAALDRDAMRRLSGGSLAFTSLLCMPLMCAMCVTVLVIHFKASSVSFALTPLLFWAPLAVLFQQVQEALRRTMLAHLRFAQALPGDAISYLLQAVLLLALRNHLTLPMIFAIITLTSAAAALFQYIQIRPHWYPLSQLKSLITDFWKLSAYMLWANLGGLITGNFYTWTLAYYGGFDAAAYFYAAANLAKPVNPLTTALSNLIIPSVARARAGGGTRFAMRIGLKYAVLGTAVLLCYFGLLGVAPAKMLHLLYRGQPDYAAKLPVCLRLLVIAWTCLFISNMTLAILNGLGYAKANFTSTIANIIVTLAISLPLIAIMSRKGAMPGVFATVIGGLLATVAAMVVAVYSFIKHHNDAPEKHDADAPAVNVG